MSINFDQDVQAVLSDVERLIDHAHTTAVNAYGKYSFSPKLVHHTKALALAKTDRAYDAVIKSIRKLNRKNHCFARCQVQALIDILRDIETFEDTFTDGLEEDLALKTNVARHQVAEALNNFGFSFASFTDDYEDQMNEVLAKRKEEEADEWVEQAESDVAEYIYLHVGQFVAPQ